MLVVDVVVCVLGLGVLARAADVFVAGAAALAQRLGISSVTVGVVVIGVGTSAPELLVSGIAARAGAADVGVGNIVGSNIANLSLVLGVAALVAPLPVRASVLRREVLLALAATAAFGWLLRDGLDRLDGVVLVVLLAVALVLLARWGRVAPGGEELAGEVREYLAPEQARRLRPEVLRTLLGLVGTLVGAQLLVTGATGIATAAGLSGGFVGLTIVAVGTSLPELVTAAQAARRGESGLVLGNLLGSNTFNALGVGAVVAFTAPGAPVPAGLRGAGVVVMLAVSLLAVVFMRRRMAVTRLEGALLVAGYGALVPLLAVMTSS